MKTPTWFALTFVKSHGNVNCLSLLSDAGTSFKIRINSRGVDRMFIQKVKSTVVALAIAGGLIVSQASAEILSDFSDVPITKSYASAVYELADRNIISGYEDGTFRPAASITRGQAAAIIAKLVKYDTKNVKDPGFKDVVSSQWSYGAIAALANAGVINGYGDGRFGPNDSITRAQMASILVKAFGLPPYYYSSSENPFTDTQRLASHQTNINILYKMGITTGTTPTTFSPNALISRSQATVLILKTEKVKASSVTLKAADFGWNSIYSYSNYSDRDEIIHAVASDKFNWNELQLVPMREGTTTFTMTGSTRDPVTGVDSHDDYRKYYVHVKKEDGKLRIEYEESEDILPTEVLLNTWGQQVKKISLATMEGETIQQEVQLKSCDYHPFHAAPDCFLIDDPGEYIATAQYASGKKVRHAVAATVYKPSFYLDVQRLEEKQTFTIDLGGTVEQFGDYIIPKDGEKIAIIKRDKNSNRFHITGVSEGKLQIVFPNSKEIVDRFDIVVNKMGSIINVNASKQNAYN